VAFLILHQQIAKMQDNFLNTPIEYLKGIGPQKAEVIKKDLRIFLAIDILNFFPFRYIDRTEIHSINKISGEESFVQLIGKLISIDEIGEKSAKRLVAKFSDGTGIIDLVWFRGARWLKNTLKSNTKYLVFGKPSKFGLKINIAHPEMEVLEENEQVKLSSLQPVYHSSDQLMNRGLNSRGFQKIIKSFLPKATNHLQELLPDYLLQRYKLISRRAAYQYIHDPETKEQLLHAQRRLKFEELLFIQLSILRNKINRHQKSIGFTFFTVGDHFNNFYKNNLPFELTNAQKRVLKEIRKDTGTGHQMNRLLQGDVGSGKTLVALLSMLIAADNGFQACLMAPTEILANQHFVTIEAMLQGLNIKIDLLVGSTKKSKRKVIHQQLLSGGLNFLIGTHALIEDIVQFKNLGFVVIDEQHRFGVEQRSKLWKKNDSPPHVLVMTATPIPRTLAMTLYGDLDISIIDELPPGRQSIKTIHKTDSHRTAVFKFIEDEIVLGRQVYIVYPLIKESEKMDYKDLMDGFESISRRFPSPQYALSIVHGKMKPKDKDFEMNRFVKGETQIMIATTVIEVGINVPNASVMIIESAERFGLSQLHQLRGRVGRGAEQSFCILMTGTKISKEGKVRINTMIETNDGFKISEVDMQLRGPGDIMGTQQSGLLNLKIADLTQDLKILQVARDCANEILDEDPLLNLEKNLRLNLRLTEINKQRSIWSKIS
jgi:ATP-dependent DNA helicase RecG